ncbi:hypothetical protein CYMTET_49913 [Cymbomonas tetramitiformis]|uniref:Uncharacterized protein n=1 Tax=Cymbomonas tetramitiformis TaxID=36881 RepID=A0AAE0BQM1_9CHLO|nr:hypothetical protein CYMTET_49913 [Cymbomonas tetramitiformis]
MDVGPRWKGTSLPGRSLHQEPVEMDDVVVMAGSELLFQALTEDSNDLGSVTFSVWELLTSQWFLVNRTAVYRSWGEYGFTVSHTSLGTYEAQVTVKSGELELYQYAYQYTVTAAEASANHSKLLGCEEGSETCAVMAAGESIGFQIESVREQAAASKLRG